LTTARPPRTHDHVALAREILARPLLHRARLVGVDGAAGSGKSSFARSLAEALGGAPVIPMDDFLAWDDLTEFWPRFEREVLEPLFAGRPVRYQMRDWLNDNLGRGLGDFREVPQAETVVFEGIGAGRRVVASRLSYLVWVEAPRELRLARGIERDGEGARALWEAFMPGEQAFHDAEGVRARADLVVDGTSFGVAGPGKFGVLESP
jgi:uridine kinase